MTAPTSHSLTTFLAALVFASGCGTKDPAMDDADPMPDPDDTAAGAAAPPAGSAGGATTDPPADGATLRVSGPVSGGMNEPFTATAADLAAAGYSEKEFFFEGEASAYAVQGEMTMDGKWALAETTEAPFKSRLLVRRPTDPAKFNGTVVVEWLNVSGGADGDPGFMYNAEEIFREGYAFVGVSAQAVGVEGGGLSLGGSGMPLKQYDPVRYGTLVHPGDDYSYDIFTHAARAIRGEGDVDVLEGLPAERLIGYGESQSAMRMVSYVNGVHPLAGAYDGFFIHSRSASGVSFGGGAGGTPFFGGSVAWIRDDLEEPVFQYQTETDVTGMLGYLAARQPDTDRLRTWEVAGTAHADQHILEFNASKRVEGGAGVSCEGANDGPKHFVIKAALHALDRWMRDGKAPPEGEPLRTDPSGAPLRDEHGNTLGGVRSPDVDVPIATLTGDPPAGGGGGVWCFLFGSTTPFTPEKLLQLYPTHADYVAEVKAAASEAQAAGFLLEPEAKAMIAEAEAAPVPE
jgi:hypothetical protein